MHKNATQCKKNKAIGVKQAWSIKNYRYVCDVSVTMGLKPPPIPSKP
jgi:hypothetical protein